MKNAFQRLFAFVLACVLLLTGLAFSVAEDVESIEPAAQAATENDPVTEPAPENGPEEQPQQELTPVTEPEQSAQQPEQPAQQPEQPAKQPEQPAKQPEQPAKQPEQPAKQPDLETASGPAEEAPQQEVKPPFVPSSLISTTQTRYVQTGNTGKLNLRESPSIYASIVGSYSNGTVVSVLGNYDGWAYVNVEGKFGFMRLEFLSLNAPSPTPVPSGIPYKPYTMYICTGNSGRLHLRESNSTYSRSKGLYPNGTAVVVSSTKGEWAFVRVGDQTGYMMLRFLTTQYVPPVSPTPGPVRQIMYVWTDNGGPLYLRTGPGTGYKDLGLYPVGTQVSVLNFLGAWNQVQVQGKTGYMMAKYLSSTKPIDPPAPVPTQKTYMYVSTGNSGKLYLRAYPTKSSEILGKYANGTRVLVTAVINEWVYVQVNGQTGYMMRQYLAGDAPTVAPTPSPITGDATVIHPKGTFVYLRSEKDSSHYSNIITKVPSGSKVRVLEWGYWWSRISYNGVVGFMVSSYLQRDPVK